MGLLTGNTTVIEHAGTYVEWSRTYSHEKYAPEKADIGFILPKGIALPDGFLLARGIVNAQLGLLSSLRKLMHYAGWFSIAGYREPAKAKSEGAAALERANG